MRKLARYIALTVFLLIVACCLWTNSFAEIPHLINYQGRLTDPSGKPVTDGVYSITFKIYDAASGSGTITPWEETQLVTLQKGIFNVLLGSVKNLNLPFDKPYWLEIKVKDEVMSPRQQITSAGYAIRAENSDKIQNKPLSDLIQAGTTAVGDLTGTYPAPTIAAGVINTSKLADGVVSQAKLKTAVGEVSVTSGWSLATLPGGEYGFYPQIRGSVYSSDYRAGIFYPESGNLGTSYSTLLSIYGGTTGGLTIYVKQRYITSSGKDHWIFLLIDKNTKDIISIYSAPDHPCYGNGGDAEKLPHPFANYDPNKHEIIILDKETVMQLKQEAERTGKSILTLINEEYKPNMVKEEKYQPLHSGKYLTQDNGTQVMQMIEKLPPYIKVRRLEKITPEEKAQRKTRT